MVSCWRCPKEGHNTTKESRFKKKFSTIRLSIVFHKVHMAYCFHDINNYYKRPELAKCNSVHLSKSCPDLLAPQFPLVE